MCLFPNAATAALGRGKAELKPSGSISFLENMPNLWELSPSFGALCCQGPRWQSGRPLATQPPPFSAFYSVGFDHFSGAKYSFWCWIPQLLRSIYNSASKNLNTQLFCWLPMMWSVDISMSSLQTFPSFDKLFIFIKKNNQNMSPWSSVITQRAPFQQQSCRKRLKNCFEPLWRDTAPKSERQFGCSVEASSPQTLHISPKTQNGPFLSKRSSFCSFSSPFTALSNENRTGFIYRMLQNKLHFTQTLVLSTRLLVWVFCLLCFVCLFLIWLVVLLLLGGFY